MRNALNPLFFMKGRGHVRVERKKEAAVDSFTAAYRLVILRLRTIRGARKDDLRR